MKINIYISFLFLSVLLVSCVDLEENPIGVLTPETFYKTANDVEVSLKGLYNTATIQSYYGENLYLDLLSDEYDVDPTTVRPYRINFNEYTFGPNDYNDDVEYIMAFNQVAHANIILDRIKTIDLTEQQRLQFESEALFVRSLVYFHLVRHFGDVTFFSEPQLDPSNGENLERTSAEIIYSNIISDLNYTVDHLPDTYSGGIRNRATRGAALALLSKIHLTLATYNEVYADAYDYRDIDAQLINSLKGEFQNHWDASAHYALEVINNASDFNYELVEDFQDLFNGEIGDTKEHIFSIDFSGLAKGGNGPGGIEGWRNNNSGLVPLRNPWDIGGWNAIVPPLNFYESFIEGDYRRDVSFNTTFYVTTAAVGGDTLSSISYLQLTESAIQVPFSAKWTRIPGPTEQWPSGVASSHNLPVLRYGEILLIAAEALNEMGRTEEAIGFINQLRERARKAGGENREFPKDIESGLSKEEAFEVIWQERSYELAFEWKRWYDLVRRGRLQEVMSEFTPFRTNEPLGANVKEFNVLLPIPQIEIDKTTLRQNKGY